MGNKVRTLEDALIKTASDSIHQCLWKYEDGTTYVKTWGRKLEKKRKKIIKTEPNIVLAFQRISTYKNNDTHNPKLNVTTCYSFTIYGEESLDDTSGEIVPLEQLSQSLEAALLSNETSKILADFSGAVVEKDGDWRFEHGWNIKLNIHSNEDYADMSKLIT